MLTDLIFADIQRLLGTARPVLKHLLQGSAAVFRGLHVVGSNKPRRKRSLVRVPEQAVNAIRQMIYRKRSVDTTWLSA